MTVHVLERCKKSLIHVNSINMRIKMRPRLYELCAYQVCSDRRNVDMYLVFVSHRLVSVRVSCIIESSTYPWIKNRTRTRVHVYLCFQRMPPLVLLGSPYVVFSTTVLCVSHPGKERQVCLGRVKRYGIAQATKNVNISDSKMRHSSPAYHTSAIHNALFLQTRCEHSDGHTSAYTLYTAAITHGFS